MSYREEAVRCTVRLLGQARWDSMTDAERGRFVALGIRLDEDVHVREFRAEIDAYAEEST